MLFIFWAKASQLTTKKRGQICHLCQNPCQWPNISFLLDRSCMLFTPALVWKRYLICELTLYYFFGLNNVIEQNALWYNLLYVILQREIPILWHAYSSFDQVWHNKYDVNKFDPDVQSSCDVGKYFRPTGHVTDVSDISSVSISWFRVSCRLPQHTSPLSISASVSGSIDQRTPPDYSVRPASYLSFPRRHKFTLWNFIYILYCVTMNTSSKLDLTFGLESETASRILDKRTTVDKQILQGYAGKVNIVLTFVYFWGDEKIWQFNQCSTPLS